MQEFGLLLTHDHRMSQLGSIPVEDLAAERLLSRPYCALSELIVSKLRELGAQNISKHEVPAVDDLPGLVQSHTGVGVWPFGRKIAGDLPVCSVKGIDLSRWIHIHTVFGRRLSPGASTLVGLLRCKDWSTVNLNQQTYLETVH